MSTPEEEMTRVELTGVDFCPACEVVVTWRRHLSGLGQPVHDTCGTALVPRESGNQFHARAMAVHESAHDHQLLDAHGQPPQVAGSPGRFEITLDLPISCAHCETASEDLVAELDDSDHDTEVVDGRLRVYPVDPVLPPHLEATLDPTTGSAT